MKSFTFASLFCLWCFAGALSGVTLFPPQAAGQDLFEDETRPGSPALKKITDRLGSATLLRADFEQIRTIKALRNPLVSNGKLLYKNGLGVVWEVTSPFPTIYALTKEYILEKGEDGSTTTVTRDEQPGLSHFTTVFLSLFDGKEESLRKIFRVFFSGDDGGWEIGLEPRDANLSRYLTNVVLKGDDVLRRIVLAEASGDRTTIDLTSVRIGPPDITAEERAKFER